MSAQAGVLFYDGRPMSPDLAESIGQHLDAFGPDGGLAHTEPGLVMIHRALHVTPEDTLEVQPVHGLRGLVLTWDGRLDARDDLCFQLWRNIRGARTDTALVLAAIETWGPETFSRLLGDWTLVLWNGETRELTFANDYAGNRPMYFSETPQALHWSTSLAELLERLELRSAPLERRFIVGYLTSSSTSEVTPYPGIRALLPGHVMTWSAAGTAKQWRSWEYRANTLRLSSDAEYESGLRAVFATAIRSRLRAARPVWAELSGGLDSSSIVCMADRVIGDDARLATSETISYVAPSVPGSDERRFVEAVAAQRGRPANYVNAESCINDADTEWGWVTPFHPSGTALGIARVVAQNGGRVLMSGNPGDLVMMNSLDLLGGIFEALANVDIPRCVQRMHQWCRATRRPIWHLLSRLFTERRVPSSPDGQVRRALRYHQASTRQWDAGVKDVFHLTSDAAHEWRSLVADRVPHPGVPRTHLRLIENLDNVRRHPVWQTPAGVLGITYTHPYMDRRLLEFILSVPVDVVCRPGEPRRLMRRAFATILPPMIVARFSKGHVHPFVAKKLTSWIPADLDAVDHFGLVRDGFVDAARLRASLQALRAGECRSLKNLEAIFKLERWLALRQRHTSGRLIPTRKEVTDDVRQARTASSRRG